MSPLILDYHSKRRNGMAKSRPFVTVPAKLQDVRRLVDIEFLAFEYEQVNQVLSFRDYKKPAHFERSVQLYENSMRANSRAAAAATAPPQDSRASSRDLRAAPEVSFLKVMDTDTGDIVSFAKLERKQYDVVELHTALDSGHEEEPRMNRDWFALNEKLRRQYVGLDKHIYIGMLATEPKHQHHGAGTMLLEEILAEADDAGVEVYLEATDTAKPLYEKHGFEAITELRFDPSQYGVKGLGTERQTVMVRGAVQGSGERRAVKPWEDAVARTKMQVHDIDGHTWDAWSTCR